MEERILPILDRDKNKVDHSLAETIRKLCRAEVPWPLFIGGPAGVGKTCAVLALSDYVAGTVYYQTRKFVRYLQNVYMRQEYNDRGYMVHEDDVWRKVANAPLAILDEIGSREKVTDHHYEAVLDFVDHRFKRPVIYISNLTLEQLGSLYDDRLASRMASGTIVIMNGDDRRITRK